MLKSELEGAVDEDTKGERSSKRREEVVRKEVQDGKVVGSPCKE